MEIKCPKCGEALELPEEAVGAKVQCPFCGDTFIGPLVLKPCGESKPQVRISPFERYLSMFRNIQDDNSGRRALGAILSDKKVIKCIRNCEVPIIVGCETDGNPRIIDLADASKGDEYACMTVVGPTGCGKSEFGKCVITTKMLKPQVQCFVASVMGHILHVLNEGFFPGVTVFSGEEELKNAIKVVCSIVKRRMECASKRPFHRILFIIDDCLDMFLDADDLNNLRYICINSKQSGVHVLALAQGWVDNNDMKKLSAVFGRKICFPCWEPEYFFESRNQRQFLQAVRDCATGQLAYTDAEDEGSALRAVYVDNDDYSSLVTFMKNFSATYGVKFDSQ